MDLTKYFLDRCKLNWGKITEQIQNENDLWAQVWQDQWSGL